MKLFLVHHFLGHSIVRAECGSAAAKLMHSTIDERVEELVVDGPTEILWQHEYDFDSRPGDD